MQAPIPGQAQRKQAVQKPATDAVHRATAQQPEDSTSGQNVEKRAWQVPAVAHERKVVVISTNPLEVARIDGTFFILN